MTTALSFCPCCHQPLPSRADQIAAKAAELREWAVARGHWIGPSGMTEAVAAAMLALSPNTLRHWRATDQRLPFARVGGGIRYSIADVAGFIVSGE